MVKIIFLGYDDWDRPVYKTEKGSLVVDVNMDADNMRLFAKYNNEFQGEPDYPLNSENFKLVKSFE